MIWVLLQSESPWQRNDAITFFIYFCVSLFQLAKVINLHQKELSITFQRNIWSMLIIGLSSQTAVRAEKVNVTAHRVGWNT